MTPTQPNALEAPHQLQLDSRARLHMTGVIEVESFDESTIVLTTTRGTLIVRGEGLHLQLLRLDGGEVLVEGRTEWCVYDVAAKAVRPTAEAGFREDLVYAEARVLDEPYARFRHDFSDGDLAAAYAVRPSDVDVGRHMNNVAYLRMLADSFSVEELERLRVREMEILFCMPCFEGERLDVLRRRTDWGYEFGVRRPDGRYAALALMRAEER